MFNITKPTIITQWNKFAQGLSEAIRIQTRQSKTELHHVAVQQIGNLSFLWGQPQTKELIKELIIVYSFVAAIRVTC